MKTYSMRKFAPWMGSKVERVPFYVTATVNGEEAFAHGETRDQAIARLRSVIAVRYGDEVARSVTNG